MELPSKSDPIEAWIKVFVDSSDVMFDDKSQKERTIMALEAYYAAQRNEEAPIMAPKNAELKPRLNIIKTVTGGAGRKGSVSLMGTGNVKEEVVIKEDLGIKRAISIVKLSLPQDTDLTLIESFVEATYNINEPFPSSIQTIKETFNKFNKITK